jgi:hypothetical protein
MSNLRDIFIRIVDFLTKSSSPQSVATSDPSPVPGEAMTMTFPARELMPMICAALVRGQHVRLTAKGGSMLPFIHDGDVVELEPVGSLPLFGHVVLARSRSEGERYVLHRVVSVRGDMLFLRGDAQKDCEGPFGQGDVLGKVSKNYYHGGLRRLDRGIWRFAALTWHRCVPLNVWLLDLADWWKERRQSI